MTRERQTFGNIPPAAQTLFYVVAAAACAVFAYGIWRRLRLWRQGAPVDLRGWGATSVRRLLREGLGQKRVLGRGAAGISHVAMFAGFMMLFLGTTLLEINHIAEMISESLKFHKGTYYLVYNFTLDVFGVIFLAGVIYFFQRRLRLPKSIGHRATDWYVLSGFLAIGITGYLLEGLRIAWDHPQGIWASCSPVGLWVAGWFSGWSDARARTVHFAVWWVHALLVFGFIASLPYTRLLHMIAGPLNIFLSKPCLGELSPVTAEAVEATGRLGAGDIRHFTQLQLLSMDACMECGRCEEACPAYASGKPLSPKKVVQDLRHLMERTLARGGGGGEPPKLHGETIQAETLWACTSCSACVDVCPVRIDPLAMIVDMRRHLVAEGGLSGTAASALRRMQSSGNPWGLPPADRGAWNS